MLPSKNLSKKSKNEKSEKKPDRINTFIYSGTYIYDIRNKSIPKKKWWIFMSLHFHGSEIV